MNYKEAEKIVQGLRLKNSEDWKKYADSSKRNPRIPKAPHIVYQGKGWTSMGNWLGTGFIATRSRKFLPFPKARAKVRGLGFSSQKEYKEWIKGNGNEFSLPFNPWRTYEDSGWNGWKDFLGTDKSE